MSVFVAGGQQGCPASLSSVALLQVAGFGAVIEWAAGICISHYRLKKCIYAPANWWCCFGVGSGIKSSILDTSQGSCKHGLKMEHC